MTDWSQFTPVAPQVDWSQFAPAPVPEGDPLTRVDASTPAADSVAAITPQFDAGAGRGRINPPMPTQAPQTSGSLAKDLAINAFGGLAGGLAGAGATLSDAVGANDTAAALDKIRQNWQGVQKENGGDTISGKAADLVGAVAPALLVPEAKAAQLISNAGLFAIPAFRDTLKAKLDEGQSFPLALAHASESFGINLFMPTVATRGSGAVVKALGGAEAAGAKGAATALGQAAVEGAGFSAASSAIDKGTDVAAGQQNDNDWVNLKDMAASALGFTGLRAAHVVPQAASAIADRTGSASQQFGRALGQDIDNRAPGLPANEVAGMMEGETLNPHLAQVEPKADPIQKIAQAGSVDEAIAAAQEAVSSTPVKAPEAAGQTVEQLLAEVKAKTSGLDSDLLAVRPLESTDVSNAVDAGAAIQPSMDGRSGDVAGGESAGGLGDSGPVAATEPARSVEPAVAVEPVRGEPAPVEPAVTWFGRAGDGYKTVGDAQMALPSRLKVAPTLDWKVEPMANGKFRLAGYGEEGAKSGDASTQAKAAEAAPVNAPAEKVARVSDDRAAVTKDASPVATVKAAPVAGESGGNNRAEAVSSVPVDVGARPARTDVAPAGKPETISAFPPAPEVSRYNGKFGKGMGFDAARMEAAKLNRKNDGITYAAEEHGDAKLENPYAVVGRRAEQPELNDIARGTKEPVTARKDVVGEEKSADPADDAPEGDRRNNLAREYMEYRESDPARAKAAFQEMSAIDAKEREAEAAARVAKPQDESYRGEHEAPMRDSGSPLHDLKGAYPDDFYGPEGPRFYGVGDGSDARAMSTVRFLKGKKNAQVTVYRAVPKDVDAKISRGDWVTIDRQYAKDHGDGALNGKYKIIQKTVRAGDLFTNGDSIQEWGYDPAGPKKNESTAPKSDGASLDDFTKSGGVLDRIAQQGYEPAEVPRVQAARKLSTLLERYNNNKISEGMFQLELQMLSHRMSAVSETKQANRTMSERERGADLVREKLIRARRQGDLDHGTVDFALWLLDKNPDLAEGLGASVRSPGEGSSSAGRYNPAARVMTLFKGKANDGTAVHEILHHSERMMPEPVQKGIANEWSKAFAKAYKVATPEQRAALDKMAQGMAGSGDAHKDVIRAFRDGTLDYDKHYQLTNPSEYWAVNATRIMAARHEATSWVGKAKQWLGEMVEKAKGAFGLASDAPILKGLKSVLEGDGTFQSKRMLSNATDLADTTKAAEAAPEEERKTYDGPGAKMIEGASNAFASVRDDLLNHVAPMSTGSQEARAAAQKFANDTRVARHQWLRMSEMIKAKYSAADRKAMWDAADEQNTLMQEGKDTTGKGLDRLDDKQRATMQTLHTYADNLWKRAQSVGMVEGDGLPFWTPRMAVMVGEDGSFSKPGGDGKKTTSSGVGRNVMTTAPSAMHRKYVGTEESEAALKAKKGDSAEYVRDILTMPLAMSRFEQAIAGRELINQVKEIGLSTGRETVANAGGPDFFTLDHPAFTSYKPRMVTDADGKVTPALDQNGEMVFDKVPLFISKEFYGPLKAVMSTTDGTIYSGYMLLKSKAMTAIMASPLTHNMVIFGRALAYSPAQVGTGYLYWKGHILAKDEALMQQAIGHGLVPIGANKNSMMDITDVARGIGRQGSWGDPNESWVNLSMQKLGNALHEGTGDAIKGKMDALGDFVHHTLLWKQVGALQIGIYNDAYQYLSAKGLSDKAAGPLAAHLANRYAGAVGQENMSEIARKAANVMLFSRSFNMGNLGAMKDALYGMPAGLKAKMLQDVGELEGNKALSYARRKARATLIADVGLSVLFLSLAQSAVDKLKKDKSWDEIWQGYVRRLNAMVSGIGAHPLDITQYNPYKISPTFDNEPGKQDRVDMGEQPGGRHEYMRLPTGKVVEDMIGWAFNPGETFGKKMSPMAKSIWQDFTNDKGFGVPVKDPEGGFWKHVYDVSAHVAEAQLPWDSVKNIYDLAQGKATPQDKDRLAGFATGFSYSQGHPGGPEAQVAAKTQERMDASKKYVMEQVKRDLKYGDVDKATERLDAIGFTPREINQIIRRIEEPKSGLSGSARRKFNQHSNDAEKALMEQQR